MGGSCLAHVPDACTSKHKLTKKWNCMSGDKNDASQSKTRQQYTINNKKKENEMNPYKGLHTKNKIKLSQSIRHGTQWHKHTKYYLHINI